MDEAPGSERAAWARAIHARLLHDDHTATHELLTHYLDPLVDWLARRYSRLGDPHLCETAAHEALLALLKRPQSYDPTRRSLWGYLKMSAEGDLKNLLRAEGRHRSRRAPLEAVELSPLVGNNGRDELGDPAALVDEAKPPHPPTPFVAGLTPEEEEVLALMRAGERKTLVYALILGLTDRPVAEQRQRVKRVKDRLQKRLSRGGGSR